MKSTIPSKSGVEIPSKSGVEQSGGCRDAAQAAGFAKKGHNPHSLSAPAKARGAASRAAWRVVSATPGDHPMIYQFLLSVFHKPTPVEFQAQLEEPSYEPADRLIIKNGSHIIAHLRLLNREMQFGRLVLPVGIITDLATAPEYRGHGCATALLSAARKILLRDGAAIGLLATDQPHFYMRRGWVVCGRHCYSDAAPREILSYLNQREAEAIGAQDSVLTPPTCKRYNIRLWRHVELAALMRLYQENMQSGHGNLVRSDSYWRWLVGRGGNQRVYVAIDGPDKIELDESLAPIVGYAATREGRIVEIMSSADHPEASVQLLARACGDAIEKDFVRVRLDAPPEHPLHQLLLQAGGEFGHHEADHGVVFMANILKPHRFLGSISRDLSQRAKDAGLPRPCQLGLLVNKDKYQLRVSRRNVELVPGSLGRSYLKCSLAELKQLFLGHLDAREVVASGRISTSTRVALETVDAIFPRLPFWRPPWDDLAAE